MPSNKPFIKNHLRKFLDLINRGCRIPAEVELDRDTSALKGSMRIMNEDHPVSEMGLDAQEANFLKLLTRLLARQYRQGPMKALDIGTFMGRSALAIAQAMPEEGKVITCDINEEYMEQAGKYWRQAGLDHRIDCRLGSAADTLDALLKDQAGTFDLVFIDADKENYPQYYAKALALLRPGGLAILDNMLWSGHVAQPRFYGKQSTSYDTAAETLRRLNISIAQDTCVDAVLLGFADGVMVVEKRAFDNSATIA